MCSKKFEEIHFTLEILELFIWSASCFCTVAKNSLPGFDKEISCFIIWFQLNIDEGLLPEQFLPVSKITLICGPMQRAKYFHIR